MSYFLCQHFYTVLVAHLAAFPKSLRRGGSFLRVKWPEREADCSLPSSAEVKNVRSLTSLPIRLNGVVLKLMNNRIFILPSSNLGSITR
jgi:hypothetical protein